MKKKIFVCIGVIIAMLIILNPTNNDFKSFITGNMENVYDNAKYGRTHYFGIFSIYESTIDPHSGADYHNKYIGIFKNFIIVTP